MLETRPSDPYPTEILSPFESQVGEALSSSGFLILWNHPVDIDLFGKAERLAEVIFNRENKEQVLDAECFRASGLWKDAAWPLQEHPHSLRLLYGQLDSCAEMILEACSVFLGKPRDYFFQMVRGGESTLRCLPRTPSDREVLHHTDVAMLTFFLGGGSDGLEIWNPRECAWFRFEVRGRALIVVVGEMLELLSEGRLKSALHRVVPSKVSRPRVALPYFVLPRPEINLRQGLTAAQFLTRRIGYPEPRAATGQS